MTAAQYLADQLERLMALPLASKEDVERWDKEAADVQTTLEEQFPDFGLEHFLHHFFTDSDIRCKDAGYREQQHRAVSDCVARLHHGAD
jgi:hypothetical protein